MKGTRKILSLGLAALLAFSPMVVFAESPYADVPEGHWAYDAIVKLADAGIITEFKDGEFRGDTPLTRFEMANIIARTLTYVVENVERMSKSQAIIVSSVLSDLVNEFERDLARMSLDITAMKEELEKIKRRQESWDIEVTASVEGVSRTVKGPGIAYEDPFSEKKKVLTSEESITPKVLIEGAGSSKGYNIDFSVEAEGYRELGNSEFTGRISDFALSISNESVSARAGLIDDAEYAPYLLSDEDESVMGIEVKGGGNVFFNDSVKVLFGSYGDGPTLGTGDTGILGVRLGHKIGDFEIAGILGYVYDGDKRTKDDYVWGFQGGYDNGKAGIKADIAFDSDLKFLGILQGYYAITNQVRTQATLRSVGDDFKGILADSDLIEPGQTLGLRLEVKPIDNLSFYGETEFDLKQSKTGYEIGADFEYEIIKGLSTRLNTSFDGDDIGYKAELVYSGLDIVEATVGVGREDGLSTIGFELSGNVEVGMVDLRGNVAMKSKGEDHFASFGGGISYNISKDIKLELDFSKSHLRSTDDPDKNYDVNEAIFAVSFRF